MPPSCFWIEQGVGHFTGAMDQELEITFSAPWSTYPTITLFQSPEISIPEALNIIDGGNFSHTTTPMTITQYSTTGAGLGFVGEITTFVGTAASAISITTPGTGYEIGDIIVADGPSGYGTVKLEIAPSHEASHMNLYVTDVTKTSFKVRTSTQYTSTSFHWRAIGKEW